MRETVAIGEFEDDFETDKERSLCHFLQFLLILSIGIAICASTVVLAVMVSFYRDKRRPKLIIQVIDGGFNLTATDLRWLQNTSRYFDFKIKN